MGAFTKLKDGEFSTGTDSHDQGVPASCCALYFEGVDQLFFETGRIQVLDKTRLHPINVPHAIPRAPKFFDQGTIVQGAVQGMGK